MNLNILTLKGATVLTCIVSLIFCGMMAKSAYNLTHQPVTLLSKAVPPISAVMDLAIQNTGVSALVRLETLEGQTFCSGTVISNTTILTAAHCMMIEGPMKIASLPDAKGHVTEALGVAYKINPRADYASVKGNFSAFSKMAFSTNPAADILYHNYNLVTCGFPYGGRPVCYRITRPEKFVDQIKAKGQMYAGMSGGPVIDLNTGTIYAVNTAVTDGYIILSPIINAEVVLN